ncbi:KAP family NTPase [Pseudomonas aeruginosa]|uniref:KAP family NTPase n=1 Tax=Pseudomonas aeruginosa TaxID=287 RepID=UPI000A57C894|nr:KAP family NTPase [Pseudomonas aeruginosa]
MATFIFRRNSKIGNLDAETDTFLKSCFLETDIYSNLLSFDDGIDFAKRIVVGRTGSGKTALIKQLSENPKIKKHLVIEAESTVFEHIKNNVFISKLIDNNIDLRIFYKSLWIHVLLVRVVELLYPGKTFFEMILDLPTSSKKKYNASLAKEYVEKFKDNFFNESIVSEITERMQMELAGGINIPPIKLDGKGSAELTEKIQRATAQYVSTELLRKQKELIKVLTQEKSREGQHRFLISIDDLDKSWLSSSEIRYDFINALLDAFKELLDIKTVKIIISVRTDIIRGIYLKNLRQEEKDKSLILDIHWDKLEIQEILDKRIDFLIKDKYQSNATTKFSDIFDFSIKNERSQDFILRRTMLRPRDAIDFVNLCLSEADGSTVLNGDVSRNPRNFRHPSWVGSTLVSPATFWRIELGHPSLDGHRSTMFNGSLTGPSFCGGYSIHKSSRFLKFQSVGSSGPVILSLQLVAARSMVCIGIGSLERSEKNTRTLGVSSDSIPGSTTTARR